MVLPFVIAVISDDIGRYLIGCHPHLEHKPYPGLWDMPGGKVEPDEDFSNALRREVKEETGYTVTNETLIAVFHHSGENIKPYASPITVPGIAICYRVEVMGDLKPTELENMHWADLKELKTLKLTPWCEYLLNSFL